MKQQIQISGNSVRLSHRPTGETLPIIEDILTLAGLEGICTAEGVPRLFDLLSDDPQSAIKFVCYECDLRQDEARNRVKRYFLIDLFVRAKYSESQHKRNDAFMVAGAYLGDLFDTWFSKNDLLKMLYIDEALIL